MAASLWEESEEADSERSEFMSVHSGHPNLAFRLKTGTRALGLVSTMPSGSRGLSRSCHPRVILCAIFGGMRTVLWDSEMGTIWRNAKQPQSPVMALQSSDRSARTSGDMSRLTGEAHSAPTIRP